MKAKNRFLLGTILGLVFVIQGCEENMFPRPGQETGILPARFKIEIPGSLSREPDDQAGLKSASSNEADTVSGNAIYAHLNTFIGAGEAAADIVQDIRLAIALYDIDDPMSLSFRGDQDNRVKNLVVTENAVYNERNWDFMLTITDAASETEADQGMALQIFWNPNPIEGIAILKPYNIDRKHDREWLDAVFRIEYSEVGTALYDAYMIVEVADLPMPDPRLNPFALNSLRMFVGKNGEQIDVFGNSDHPNARFFTDKKGFSWAFAASGYDHQNIAVAEVGLPPSLLDESDREILLKQYSIKNVLTEEIDTWFTETFGFGPDSAELAGYLRNADAPGFFNAQGFISGGESPSEEYDGLVERIEDLAPYSPRNVHELEIDFQ